MESENGEFHSALSADQAGPEYALGPILEFESEVYKNQTQVLVLFCFVIVCLLKVAGVCSEV